MQAHSELRLLLADEIPLSGRESLLRHLRGCTACRAALAAERPSRLFALLALEPVPEALLERLSASVAVGIAGSPAGAPTSKVRWGWASIAASLLLAVAFSTYLLDRGGPQVDRSGPRIEPVLASTASVIEDRGAESAFELLSSPGTAQVVDLSVGGDHFVMIFDEELDL